MVNDIDLLNLERGDAARRKRKNKPKIILKFLTYLASISIIILFVFTSRVLMSEDNGIVSTFSFLSQFKHLAQTSDNMLKGEENDRINILLLGVGGDGHEGGTLSDTIMFASIIPSTGNIALLSIPRDLIVPVEGYGWRKVNNINAFAEAEERGGGGLATSQALSRVLDLPIDYYVRVDFAAFSEIIDELGGIEVEVENTLEDLRYPVPGREEAEDYNSRYEHLYIEKGLREMDGSLALKYARSRHAQGIEGSDFARSRRQQKILEAVKEKVTDLRILFKPHMISKILNSLEKHVSTNLKVWEMVKLWDMTKDTGADQTTNKILDNSESGLLVDYITAEGAYVLQPRSGDFDEIQYLAKNIFSGAPLKSRQQVAKEYPKLEIQNGTWVNGLASRVATDLEKYGFAIVNLDNASRQNYEYSIIFDLSYGEKMQSLMTLKEKMGARINYGLPDWLVAELAKKNEDKKDLIQPDFILILGQDADKTKSGAENKEE